jgi:hypothetical protein
MIFASAAAVVSGEVSSEDTQAVCLAGVEGALRTYESILREEPESRWPFLDKLLVKQKSGKLPSYVKSVLRNFLPTQPVLEKKEQSAIQTSKVLPPSPDSSALFVESRQTETAQCEDSSMNKEGAKKETRIVVGISTGIAFVMLIIGLVLTFIVPDAGTVNGVKLRWSSPGVSYQIGGNATSMARKYSGEAFGPYYASVQVSLSNKNDYPVSATVVCTGAGTSTIKFEEIPARGQADKTTTVEVSAGGRYGDTVHAHIDKCELTSVSPATSTQQPALEKRVARFFDLKMPNGWKSFSEAELLQFARQYEEQSKDLFLQFHGRPEDYPTLVQEVVGLASPDGSVTLAGVVMRIPPQANNYIETMFTRGQNLFESERREGKIRDFLHKRITIFGVANTKHVDVPAIRSELLWANGDRHIVTTFHFIEAPSFGGIVLVVMKKDAPLVYREQAEFALNISLLLSVPTGEK